MKITKDLKETVNKAFAHSESRVLYFTSDGRAFTESHNADSQAQRLPDQDVLTVTRSEYETGAYSTITERAQEAAEGKIKTVETIPSEVVDLENDEPKDAATVLTKEVKEVQTGGNPDNPPVAAPTKAELTPRYKELFNKAPGVQWDAATVQQKITEEEARLAAEQQ